MRFIKDIRGSSYIWATIIILILCMISVVVYNIIFIYSEYQTMQTELERASTITVSSSMENKNVRDLKMDIPVVNAEQMFKENLIYAGYIQTQNGWIRTENNKIMYKIENIQTEFDGEIMNVTAEFVVTPIWEIGEIAIVRIPINIRSRVLYIDY